MTARVPRRVLSVSLDNISDKRVFWRPGVQYRFLEGSTCRSERASERANRTRVASPTIIIGLTETIEPLRVLLTVQLGKPWSRKKRGKKIHRRALSTISREQCVGVYSLWKILEIPVVLSLSLSLEAVRLAADRATQRGDRRPHTRLATPNRERMYGRAKRGDADAKTERPGLSVPLQARIYRSC